MLVKVNLFESNCEEDLLLSGESEFIVFELKLLEDLALGILFILPE